MRLGLPRELLPIEWVPELKDRISQWVPDVEWVHDAAAPVQGRLLVEGDACYPFKKIVRTALSLLHDVEALILPRIVSLDGFLMCPNFRALPDMVKMNRERIGLDERIPMVAPVMEISGKHELDALAKEISESLVGRPVADQDPPVSDHRSGPRYAADRDISNTIALIGHPYVIKNPRLNNHVPDILKMNGCDMITAQEIPFKMLTNLAQSRDYYAKKLYWRSARETLGAFLYFSRIQRPAGIIHLVPFNCGVDALLRIELMGIHKRLDHAPPYMVIVCDEHTQRDHVVTRIEAFLDIVHGIRIN